MLFCCEAPELLCVLQNFRCVFFLISKQYNGIMFACAAPVPGCPGCGEGSVSVCKHRKNLSHSHGGQVISHIISYVRVYEGPFKNLGFMSKLKVIDASIFTVFSGGHISWHDFSLLCWHQEWWAPSLFERQIVWCLSYFVIYLNLHILTLNQVYLLFTHSCLWNLILGWVS